MLKKYYIFFGLIIIAFACNKDDANEGPFLPNGTTPYTAIEVAFVPYTSQNLIFKKAPGFTDEINVLFNERLVTENVYAWDQTFFQLGDDSYLEIEFRLRYLQTETGTADKTLAVYMPYWDNAGVVRTSIFEMPITPVGIEAGALANVVTFHPTIDLFGTIWEDVYEVEPLVETPLVEDNPENFSKIFYNTSFGLIEMDQKNGSKWVLAP